MGVDTACGEGEREGESRSGEGRNIERESKEEKEEEEMKGESARQGVESKWEKGRERGGPIIFVKN